MSNLSTNPSEEAIIRAAQAGGTEAFLQLIELYDRRLLYFVLRLLGDEAGAFDVLQIVWLSVHRKLHKLRSPEAFRSWIYRIAHDHAISELRRRGRRLELSLDVLPESALEDSTQDESVFEKVELVHRGLQQLSFEHRRVLTLKFLEDMSIEQIADVVGTTQGTVKSRLHYAKLALRHWIEGQAK